jgi:tetratricopeptide (TPR) repeat protein
MTAEYPNALLLYRLAEQEKALNEAFAEIRELRKDQKSDSKLLHDDLAKDISDKFSGHDKRISDLHIHVNRWGTIIPLLLFAFGVIGGWKIYSDSEKITQNWLNKDGKTFVSTFTNEHLNTEEGRKNLKEAVHQKLTPDYMALLANLAASGDRRSVDPSRAAKEITVTPSAEAQKALDAARKQPDDQRSSEVWRALIYSYADKKQYEVSVSFADQWLASPYSTPDQTAVALNTKGNILYRAGQFQTALNSHEEVIRRFGSDTSPALREQVAWAFFYKGLAYGAQNPPQRKEEISAYSEVINRFGADKTQVLREITIRALFYKGLTFNNLTPPDPYNAIATFDDVIAKISSDDNKTSREYLAWSLLYKGITENALTPPKYEEAVATYNVIIEKFSTDNSITIQRLVADAIYRKGLALIILGKLTEARSIFENYLNRYSNIVDPNIQAMSASVRSRLGQLPKTETKP